MALSRYLMLAFPGLMATAVAAEPLALTGATLIDGTGAEPVRNSVVLVDSGRIACAGNREDCPFPDGVREVSLKGRYITPGLVDAHVHYAQTGWADGRPDSLDVRDNHPYAKTVASLEANAERWHRSYLCSGVTAVFDVGGYPWTWNVRNDARADSQAPHYAAAGPLLTTLDHWVNLPGERQFLYLSDDDAVDSAVEYLAANDTDAVKLWFINPEQADFDSLRQRAARAAKLASNAGLPFIVHATGLQEARAAVDAGTDLLVHSVDDAPVDKAFVETSLASNVIYTPTLTVMSGYYQMYRAALSGETPEIDDPNGCVDDATIDKVSSTVRYGDRISRSEDWLTAFRERLDRESSTMAKNLLSLHEAGVTIATGSDAGNPLTLHGPAIHAEMEAMQAAGMGPMDVIVASTRNGARAMGGADEFGTLESGKSADLLVLGSDPLEDVAHFRDLEYVMRAGVLHEQASLRAD